MNQVHPEMYIPSDVGCLATSAKQLCLAVCVLLKKKQLHGMGSLAPESALTKQMKAASSKLPDHQDMLISH